MSGLLPFLTAYDPPGSSEGTLDPMGLYQVADRLAGDLVPAVRERMQRVRFLTPIAVGSFVTAGLEPNADEPQTAPFLVWEWLVIEAILRTYDGQDELWGVPGTLVTRRAIKQHGYLDSRSYLKTARIYGFHGVFKRLAVHVGLVSPDMNPRGPRTQALAEAWAQDSGLGGFDTKLLKKWRDAVQRSLRPPVRTRTSWQASDWRELAEAFAPWLVGPREKAVLQQLLLDSDQLRALPAIWQLQDELAGEDYTDEVALAALRKQEPVYASLIDAIFTYEAFGRALQDGFDLLRAAATGRDLHGLNLTSMADDTDFAGIAGRLPNLCERAQRTLTLHGLDLVSIFQNRFSSFLEPMAPHRLALEITRHHERIQQGKGDKRPWFDWLEEGSRLYVRASYRTARPEAQPQRFVHDYRAKPIRLFHNDLQ
ncbi:MAG: hypothetical protein WD534_15305 [Phycisphaeraceae bacterium]